MKVRMALVLISFLILAGSVQAQETVNKTEYQQDVLDVINQYREKFDDCFLTLPEDFPYVASDFADLNDRIDELTEEKWYHRIVDTSMFGQKMEEILFYMKWGNTRYVISIQYFFNNNSKSFTIPSISLLSDDYGGGTGEFGHIIEGGIPHDVAEASLNVIDECMGTPGFLFLSVLMAIAVVLIYYSRYKK